MRRIAKDYFRLYRSRKPMVVRLEAKQIRYAVTQCAGGRKPSEVAPEIGVTTRHVQRMYARFRKTGDTHHVPLKPGRKKSAPVPDGDVRAVLEEYKHSAAGVVHTAKRLRRQLDISYYEVYRIMKENGLVTPSAAKSMPRKYVRFERKYSNAMWHVDWHTMKDPRFAGLNLVTFLDDSSRCVTGAGLFREATSENVVAVLRQAVAQFGAPATILSDNGKCFVGARSDPKKKKSPPKGGWRPTAFEEELLNCEIGLINSRPYHPQTNGKLERFHRSIEEEIWNHKSLSAYIDYYNEDRLHWSLDIDNYETPLRAFSDREATEAIRKNNPRWMEEDIGDGAT